jgi:hypothetical protein
VGNGERERERGGERGEGEGEGWGTGRGRMEGVGNGERETGRKREGDREKDREEWQETYSSGKSFHMAILLVWINQRELCQHSVLHNCRRVWPRPFQSEEPTTASSKPGEHQRGGKSSISNNRQPTFEKTNSLFL